MKIFLLTPIYATTTEGAGATPVVHYFAKEWVKLGHEVYVYNLRAKFPSLYYWVGKRFQHQINNKLGMLIPTEMPHDEKYEAEGVKVQCVCLKKFKPHSEYSPSEINRAVEAISEGCRIYGVPDVFIGHWENPQLEVLNRLKSMFDRPTALVLHTNIFNLAANVVSGLKHIDYLGFRNINSQKDFESKYFKPKNSFIAYSGVSSLFIESGESFKPSFFEKNKDFVFVGSLIARKFPLAIVEALNKAYCGNGWHMKFIGDGGEKASIEKFSTDNGLGDNVEFTGRIARESIIEHLKQSQFFVMISQYEVFGLVYLEAMALGLIPIGSRNEGIDGIIVDGENGFLCEAGNVDELAQIFTKISNLPLSELERISENAKKTAMEFTDAKVAERYIYDIRK